MATTKQRLNITLPPALDEVLTALAKRDKVPKSAIAVELLKSAIEREEDAVLYEIAEARANEKNVKYIPHDEFWKSLDVE